MDKEKDELDDLLGDPEEDLGDDDMADEIDVDEALPEKPQESAKPPEPPKPVALPSCKKCGKDQSAVPLLYKDGVYLCGDCSKAEQAALAAPPPPPVAKPPENINWHMLNLQNYDAQRIRVVGTKEILQVIPGGMTDEAQMYAGDRIVVTLVKADGKKYKVYDKTMERGSTARLFIFKMSLWLYGACTLPLHMQQGSGLTPSNYR